MKRLTDGQLSTLLGEHAARQLVRGGASGWADCITDDNVVYPCGCIEQVRVNCPWDVNMGNDDLPPGFNTNNSNWFDANYQRAWTEEQFLHEMEEKEIA